MSKYFIVAECNLSDVSHNLDQSLSIIEAMSGLMTSAIESRFDDLSNSLGSDQAENLFNGIRAIATQARIAQSLVDSAIAGEELEN